MSYEHIEEIQGRKGEKIAAFLTLENAMGLVLGALPTCVATSAMPFLLHMLIVLAAAGLGIVLTLDLGGMAGYEWIVWRVRGLLRLRIQSPMITPEQLAGAAVVVRAGRPLSIGGPVQLRDDVYSRPPVVRHSSITETPHADIPTQ